MQLLCLFYVLIGSQAIKRKMDILVRNCLIARANNEKAENPNISSVQLKLTGLSADTYTPKYIRSAFISLFLQYLKALLCQDVKLVDISNLLLWRHEF